MRRITYFEFMLILILSYFLTTFPAGATDRLNSDTTFRYNNRMIRLADSADQVRIKVFETSSTNDTIPYKQIYEGIYTEEKSYEKWTVVEELGFQIPLLSKKFGHHNRDYKMEPHWAGIGLGFSCVTNPSNFSLSPVDGFELKSERSSEFFINIFEKILPLYRNTLGITTGMGIDWRKYYLDNNKHLVETNGITSAVDAPEGINYKYSFLKVVYLTFPVLLEWQPTFGDNHTAYLSAGVVGGVKTYSSSKVKYENSDGHTVKSVEDRGLNVAPLTLDYLVQAGIGNVSIYAKYSPFSLFQKDKGPDVRGIALGMVLDL